ncbi:peptidyl-prolyl cis-trans isomerase [Sphingosinithalassobacter portus]|uniref:peptidylprolyl isomerase n=1 Tax=Stakelama portus TaxID=2676234 RepID=UPI000D6DC8AA|nr:peptidylprolyl isomerase [Sphingosinithalassobacter portus]
MTSSEKGGRIHRILRGMQREPLVHFLAVGLVLFLLYALANPVGADAGEHIAVDRQRLLDFVQSRQATVDDSAGKRLEKLTPAEVRALVDEYVREQAMYREAERLGLADEDYLIRRRLAQSLDFLYRNMEGVPKPTEQQLRDYYAAHIGRYAAAPAITFSHIYFSGDLHGWDGAERLARQTLRAIQTRGEDAVLAQRWPGDRFVYQLNYAERDKSLIASHFGVPMADRLFSIAPHIGEWQGPFRSTSGWHLVRIEERDSAGQMPFEAVVVQVQRDWVEAQKQARADAGYARLRERYDIGVSPEIRGMMTDKAAQ